MEEITTKDVGREVLLQDGTSGIIESINTVYNYVIVNGVGYYINGAPTNSYDKNRIIGFLDSSIQHYLHVPWFLEHFNEGYCICYLKDNIKEEVPIESKDYQILDKELALHIVKAHNKLLESE